MLEWIAQSTAPAATAAVSGRNSVNSKVLMLIEVPYTQYIKLGKVNNSWVALSEAATPKAPHGSPKTKDIIVTGVPIKLHFN